MPSAYDQHRHSSPITPTVNGIIGVVASLSTNLVLYPLDLIKVRLQGRWRGNQYRARWHAMMVAMVAGEYANFARPAGVAVMLQPRLRCKAWRGGARCARWWPRW
jgi:hypothetical protein